MNANVGALAALSPREKRALLATIIRPEEAVTTAPLSHGQKALWFIHQNAPQSAAYNVGFSARIFSHLDVAAMERAVQALVNRHGQLRALFRLRGGEPVQEIAGFRPAALTVTDAAGWSEAALKARTEAAYRAPFDLEKGPLFRVALFSRAADEHVLLITVHHIVHDGWSLWLTLDELQRLYTAEVSGSSANLPVPSRSYLDFVRQQQLMLAGPEGTRLWQYWKQRLAGELPTLNLPTDFSRPPIQGFRGASQPVRLERGLAGSIRKLAQAEGATPFIVLLAAFQVFLHRYTGQEDILVGSPAAGRADPAFTGVVGYFVNPVVQRADLAGNPMFRSFLHQVRDSALQAMDHQDFPYPLLVEQLNPQRDPSISPVLQAFFVLQKSQMVTRMTAAAGENATRRFAWGGLELEHLGLPQQEGQFDLELELLDTGGAFDGWFKYNADLWAPETVTQMAANFTVLLRGIADDPDQAVGRLPLLPEAEHQRILRAGSAARVSIPGECLHTAFERQARARPRAIALTQEDESLTYGELDARSDQVARYLRALGVGPEVLVGLYAERSFEMMIGMLGILKAGGAYLPLDPASPPDRLAFIIEDSRISVVLTQQALAPDLPTSGAAIVRLDADWSQIASARLDDPGPAGQPAAPHHLAYVIYTSGSTGRPKGVEVTHANVVRLFSATHNWYGFGPDDVWTMFHSFAFDFSVWEIWGALIYGGRLVIVPQHTTRAPTAFVALCAAQGVTVLNQTPSAFRQFMQAEERQPARSLALRLVIFGGEALELRSLRPWFERNGDTRPQLVNMYGITETTVHVTYRPLTMADTEGSRSVIGVPIPDLGVHLLDRHLQPVPDGVAGEIHVGGAGVARGYLRRPDLTAARFVSNPFASGARLYRSGDLARRVRNGDIEYLGRIDTQVKIRGFRIELGEIETVLGQHPELEAVVVTVHQNKHNGDRQLVAYVVPRPKCAPSIAALRHFLSERLPGYMVPALFVTLGELPLTGNGKVSYRALPAPDETIGGRSQAVLPPRDTTERQLVRLWADVLGVAQIGIRDNFFELGGHSMLAVSLMAEIERVFGCNLPIATLFRHPTVERLALELSGQTTAEPWSPVVPIRPEGAATPFFCVAGGGGNVLYFHHLAGRLPAQQPFYGLQAVGLDGERAPLTRVEEIAAENLRAIRRVQAEGPYRLGGHCFGGWVAFEMAQQLRRDGQQVALVALLDSPAPRAELAPGADSLDEAAWLERLGAILTESSGVSLGIDAEALRCLDAGTRIEHFRACMQNAGLLPPGAGSAQVRGFLRVFIANSQARYVPRDVRPVPLILFRAGTFHHSYDYSSADDPGRTIEESTLGWGAFGETRVHVVPGNHITMMSQPQVAELAAKLAALLA
jgi:amino acid adenylation domain-containing protein